MFMISFAVQSVNLNVFKTYCEQYSIEKVSVTKHREKFKSCENKNVRIFVEFDKKIKSKT